MYTVAFFILKRMPTIRKDSIMDSKVDLYEYCKKSIPGFIGFTDIQSQIFEQHDFWTTTRNVFVTAPTASGKSLIAYAAMAQTRNRKMLKSLYVVPFRALASQKYSEILDFFHLIDDKFPDEIDYHKIYISTSEDSVNDRAIRNGDAQIVVTIYEKLFLFINQQKDFLSQYDVIVMDEFGVVSDPDRGLKIDFTYMSCVLHPNIRLLTLSTPFYKWDSYLRCNPNCIQVESHDRPYPLTVYHCFKQPWGDYASELSEVSACKIRSRDDLLSAICANEYLRGNSVLVFCHSRERSRKLVETIYKFFLKNEILKEMQRLDIEEEFQYIYDDLHISIGDMYGLFEDDEQYNGEFVGNMKAAFLEGITFHNASQPYNLRAYIEQNFLSEEDSYKRIQVVVATDTLAYGINSSASTVIIDAQSESTAMMTQYEYLNYCGRAGRNSTGSVYVLYRDQKNYIQLMEIVQGAYQEISTSFISSETSEKRPFYILTLLNRKRSTKEELINQLSKLPLTQEQGMEAMEAVLDQCLEQLKAKGLITLGDVLDLEEDVWRNTELGNAICGYVVGMNEYQRLMDFVMTHKEDDTLYLLDYFCMLSSLPRFRDNIYFYTNNRAELGNIFHHLHELCDSSSVSAATSSYVRNVCQVRNHGNQRHGYFHGVSDLTISSLRQALVYTYMLRGASVEELYHIGHVTISTVQSLMVQFCYYTELAVQLAEYNRKTRLATDLKNISLCLALNGVPYSLICVLDPDIQMNLSAADSEQLKRMYYALHGSGSRIVPEELSDFHYTIWEILRKARQEGRLP